MRVKRVTIKGLWGFKDIGITFFPDVTFLIGVNGSGKTTVVNLLAATLQVDFPTLDRLPFKRVKVTLESDKKDTVFIEVEKTERDTSPYPDIKYSITLGNGKKTTFSLRELEDENQYRHHVVSSLHQKRSFMRGGLTGILNDIVKVSWLSIHRTPSHLSKDDRSYESTVDKKLEQQSRELGRFLSILDSKDKLETEKFQKSMFLSMLPSPPFDMFPSHRRTDSLHDKKAFEEILRSFNVSLSDEMQVEQFFKLVEKANAALKNGDLSAELLFALYSAQRIHSVVKDWNKLLQKRHEIYKPREEYLSVVNGLLQGKTVEITEKNEAVAKLHHADKIIPLTELSSGEKQLLIILGEALLNQQQDWVYIADEPELSLHVNWQSAVVNSLLSINSRVQLIFATHSPDIVADYGTRVVKM